MEQRTANDEAEPEGKELEHEDAEDDGVYTIDIVLPCPWHSLPGKKNRASLKRLSIYAKEAPREFSVRHSQN